MPKVKKFRCDTSRKVPFVGDADVLDRRRRSRDSVAGRAAIDHRFASQGRQAIMVWKPRRTISSGYAAIDDTLRVPSTARGRKRE